MRDPTFMSSHPTGVPAGLPELTPVIVNHSPELASRRGYENQQFEEDLQVRSQLFEKQAASMDAYAGLNTMPYRARDQAHAAQGHPNPYMKYDQQTFAGNVGSATLDLSRSSQQPGGYSSMQHYGRVTSWQPQYGPPGTEVQITLLTQVKIDANRQVMARFGRDEVVALCHGGHDASAPYKYLVSVQAPAQNATQWSKPHSAIPFCLFIPYEGIQICPEQVGTFTYTDSSAAASPTESELEPPRRPSMAYNKYESESPRHTTDATIAQLPPMKASNPASTGYYTGSVYSTSAGSAEDYHNPPSTSSYYNTPSLVSSLGQITPPTPTWAPAHGSTSAIEGATNSVIPSTAAASSGVGPIRNNPIFVRMRTDGGDRIGQPGSRHGSGFNPYGIYPNHKANLQLMGNLNDMMHDWSAKETQSKRRIVQFHRTQEGNVVNVTFEAVDPEQRSQNAAAVVSCIYWEDKEDKGEKGQYYVTSVDTISLLERLIIPDKVFTVEERNRIRRNMEGFHPETIGKGKIETEGFFKQIMNYPNPRPRNIEKDIKVFKWSDLGIAMGKIFGKYAASYASTQPGGKLDNRNEIQIHQDTNTRTPLPLPLPYSNWGQQAQMPSSATSSNFSDNYTPTYSSYSQPQTPSYASYTHQQQYPGMQDSQMILQHHRPSVAYPSFMDNSNSFMS